MPQMKRTPPRIRADSLRSTTRSIEKTTRSPGGARSTSGHAGGSKPRERWVIKPTSSHVTQNIGQEARPSDTEGNSADTALLPPATPAITSPSNPDIQISRTPLFSPAVATPASVNSGGSRTSINRRPTEAQLQDALVKCRAEIVQFRHKFDCVANWEGQVVIQSSQLDMQVDLIQKMALNFPTHLSELTRSARY